MEALKDEKKQILKDIEFFLYRRDKISVFTDAVEFDALDLSIRTVPYKQAERIERMNQILTVYTDEQERKKFGEICSGINNMLSKMLDHYGFTWAKYIWNCPAARKLPDNTLRLIVFRALWRK